MTLGGSSSGATPASATLPILGAGNTSAGVTRYHSVTDNGTIASRATEADADAIIPAACTLKSFYFRTRLGTGAGQSVTATVRKNAAATALTVTIPQNQAANTQGSITGQSVAFAAGDRINVEITTVGVSGIMEWGIGG